MKPFIPCESVKHVRYLDNDDKKVLTASKLGDIFNIKLTIYGKDGYLNTNLNYILPSNKYIKILDSIDKVCKIISHH